MELEFLKLVLEVKNPYIGLNSVFGVIRSQAAHDRHLTLQENLYSFEARNFVAITVDRGINPENFKREAVNKLFERCFDPLVFENVTQDSITPNLRSFQDWLVGRGRDFFSQLELDHMRCYDWQDYLSHFKLMVKTEAKQKLDASALVKHNPAQNIVFHIKFINAIFSSIFKQLQERIMACLNPNIIWYTSMSVDGLADRMFALLGGENIYNCGEIDFSKFDKSQDVYIKACELEVYRRFKIDDYFLDLWSVSEMVCHATSTEKELSFEVRGQRRSGTANTFLGNSLVTLLLLSQYYDLRQFKCLTVAGDDSLFFSEKGAVADQSANLMKYFGMETKFFRDLPPYFCSKFIIFTGTNLHVVPDPYKLMVKLGKPLNDWDELTLYERFISFRDYTKSLNHESVVTEVTKAINIRYNIVGLSTYAAVASLHCLAANYSRFRELYPDTSGFFTYYTNKLSSYFLQIYDVLGRTHWGTTAKENYILTPRPFLGTRKYDDVFDIEEPWLSLGDVSRRNFDYELRQNNQRKFNKKDANDFKRLKRSWAMMTRLTHKT